MVTGGDGGGRVASFPSYPRKSEVFTFCLIAAKFGHKSAV